MALFQVVKTSDAIVNDGQVMLSISRTDGKKGKSGVCIVAPALGVVDLQAISLNDTGKAWMIDCLNDLRSRMASAVNAKGEVITEFRLNHDAMIVAMKVESESQRMTSEAIGKWFDADLAVLLADALRVKMVGVADDKLAILVNQFKELFQSLSGRNVAMPENQKNQLMKALDLLADDYDSVIGNKVTEKLIGVKGPEAMAELL